MIAGAGVPIVGEKPAAGGEMAAYARPGSFTITVGEGPRLAARVRNVLLAGPEARIDCVLDSGAIEVRIYHEQAGRPAPKDRVTLAPRSVRVRPREAERAGNGPSGSPC